MSITSGLQYINWAFTSASHDGTPSWLSTMRNRKGSLTCTLRKIAILTCRKYFATLSLNIAWRSQTSSQTLSSQGAYRLEMISSLYETVWLRETKLNINVQCVTTSFFSVQLCWHAWSSYSRMLLVLRLQWYRSRVDMWTRDFLCRLPTLKAMWVWRWQYKLKSNVYKFDYKSGFGAELTRITAAELLY